MNSVLFIISRMLRREQEIGKMLQNEQTEPEGVYRYAELGEVCS